MALMSELAARGTFSTGVSGPSFYPSTNARGNNRPSFAAIRSSPFSRNVAPILCSSSSDYVWHSAMQSSNSHQHSSVAAVLVGWLGSDQRHLTKFAKWYTSRGMHAITVSVPAKDFLRYYLDTGAQFNTNLLVQCLDQWLNEDQELPGDRSLLFHTFCAGWLVYSIILEAMLSQHRQLAGRIKGCIMDSAPTYKFDPQILARGFSIAILKKRSSYIVKSDPSVQTKPAAIESIVVAILNMIFSVIKYLPRTMRKFNHSVELLSKNQPPYPQLYLYSSGDRVLPCEFVKEFMIQQRRDGKRVSSCDFVWSPHLSHLRCQPLLYTKQLTTFIEDCLSSSSSSQILEEAVHDEPSVA